jgi:hypothetical protein
MAEKAAEETGLWNEAASQNDLVSDHSPLSPGGWGGTGSFYPISLPQELSVLIHHLDHKQSGNVVARLHFPGMRGSRREGQGPGSPPRSLPAEGMPLNGDNALVCELG